MNIHQLQCFIETAKCLNFTKASELLYVSQSTVVYQIAQLEAELGYPLFYRSKRRIRLTDAGHAFARNANILLELMDKTIEEARQAHQKENSRIIFGHHASLTDSLFLDIIAEFKMEHSAPNIVFRSLPGHILVPEVNAGNIDIAIVMKNDICNADMVEAVDLYTEQEHAIMSISHPLACKSEVTLEDLLETAVVLLPSASIVHSPQPILARIMAQKDAFCTQEAEGLDNDMLYAAISPYVMVIPGKMEHLQPSLVQLPFAQSEPVQFCAIRNRECVKPGVRRLFDELKKTYESVK